MRKKKNNTKKNKSFNKQGDILIKRNEKSEKRKRLNHKDDKQGSILEEREHNKTIEILNNQRDESKEENNEKNENLNDTKVENNEKSESVNSQDDSLTKEENSEKNTLKVLADMIFDINKNRGTFCLIERNEMCKKSREEDIEREKEKVMSLCFNYYVADKESKRNFMKRGEKIGRNNLRRYISRLRDNFGEKYKSEQDFAIGTLKERVIRERNKFDSDGYMLMFACKFGNKQIVEFLLENKKKLIFSDNDIYGGFGKKIENYVKYVNKKDDSNWTPLHHACEYGDKYIVKLLLDSGAVMNEMSDNGSPLCIAIYNNKTELVDFLLEEYLHTEGLEKIQRLRTSEWRKIFEELIMEGKINEDIIELLLTKGGMDSKVVDDFGSTVLNYIICNDYEKSLSVKLLSGNEKNLERENEVFFTPLTAAILYNRENFFDILLEKQINIVTSEENAIVLKGLMSGNLLKEFRKLIYDKFEDLLCNKNKKCEDSEKREREQIENILFTIKIKNGRLGFKINERMEQVLEKRIIDEIKVCFNKEDYDRIKILINVIDYKKECMNRCLWIACKHGNEEITKLLLNKDVDINSKDDFGNTALHYACELKNEEIMDMLIEKGAHLLIENKNENLAIDKIIDYEQIDFRLDVSRELENKIVKKIEQEIITEINNNTVEKIEIVLKNDKILLFLEKENEMFFTPLINIILNNRKDFLHDILQKGINLFTSVENSIILKGLLSDKLFKRGNRGKKSDFSKLVDDSFKDSMFDEIKIERLKNAPGKMKIINDELCKFKVSADIENILVKKIMEEIEINLKKKAHGYIDRVKILINIIDYKKEYMNKCLRIACKYADEKITDMLLNKKIDIDSKDENGNTALHYACKLKDEDIIDILIENGASLFIENKNREITIDRIRKYDWERFRLDVSEKLENKIIEKIKQEIVDAIENGDIKKVKLAINKNNKHIKNMTYNGQSFLWHACQKYMEDIALYLLDEGFDIDEKSKENGETLCMCACENNLNKLLNRMIKMKVNKYAKDKDGVSILEKACIMGNKETLEILKDDFRKSINSKFGIDKQTLLILAASHGNLETVEFLLNNGANPNEKDGSGRTAIVYAYYLEEYPIIDLLLNRRANPQISYIEGGNLENIKRWYKKGKYKNLLRDNVDKISKKVSVPLEQHKTKGINFTEFGIS